MSQSKINRLLARLDRYEANLDERKDRLKQTLCDSIENRFALVKNDMGQLRNRILRADPSRGTSRLASDGGPSVQAVSYEDFVKHKREILNAASMNDDVNLDEDQGNVPSTSTGRKRKQSSSQSHEVTKKRKTNSDRPKKHACKFQGCQSSFPFLSDLISHKRFHLGIKPFRCTWSDCGFASERRSHIVRHVRGKHFKLPQFVKKQKELGIVDTRDPNIYIEVDQELAARRL